MHCIWVQTGLKWRRWDTAGIFKLFLTRCEIGPLKFHDNHLVFLYGNSYLRSKHKCLRFEPNPTFKTFAELQSCTLTDYRHCKHKHRCIFTRSIYAVCPTYHSWFEFFLLKTAENLSAFHLVHFILCIFLIQNWKREHSVHPVTHVWLFRENKIKKEISNVLTISILKINK